MDRILSTRQYGTRYQRREIPRRRARGWQIESPGMDPFLNFAYASDGLGRTHTAPWNLDYHGKGKKLESGEVFLLPRYMGLYHKFIEAAAGK